MKEYITAVMSTSVLSTVILLIAPEKWRKYIKIITGMIIMGVMIFPISSVKDIELFEGAEAYTDSDFDIAKKVVKNEMEEEISKEIAKKLKEECNFDCNIEATITLNNNMIEGIEKIVVWSDKKSEQVQKKLTEEYGCSEIIFKKKMNF